MRLYIFINLYKNYKETNSNYYYILSITGDLFYCYLFRTEETINDKKFRLWFRHSPFYSKSNDETIKKNYFANERDDVVY
jgi:hypothetical protein